MSSQNSRGPKCGTEVPPLCPLADGWEHTAKGRRGVQGTFILGLFWVAIWGAHGLSTRAQTRRDLSVNLLTVHPLYGGGPFSTSGVHLGRLHM